MANHGNNEELVAVTEVGVFGGLNIEDPTKKKIQAKDMDAVIEAAIEQNRQNL